MSAHLPARVTGHPLNWSRDFAIVGGASGLLCPLGVLAPLTGFGAPMLVSYLAAAAVAGAVSGAMLGAALPFVLDGVRGRLPLPALWLGGPSVGLLWGGLVGAVAGWATGVPVMVSAVFAALAAAWQFGGFWFPYAFQTVVRGRTWPVVAAAVLVAPALGWAALLSWSVGMMALAAVL